MSFKRILVCFATVLAFAVPAFAQQTNLTPTQLALEVRFHPKEAPGYQIVPAGDRKAAWWGRFARVPGWKQPTDWPPVSAVNIKSELAEDGVRVWVSAYLGEMHEQEKDIASYVIHEGEKLTVNGLADLGVVPFEIKLVRVGLSSLELPQFTSKAKSIELVAIQPVLATMPSFEVVVRNVSNKNISAFREQIIQSGRAQILAMPQGKEGQPLIPVGGIFTFTARVATRALAGADGYTPYVLPNQTIEIATVIFDDETFEGDVESAISFAAFQKGRSLQLARVIELLDRASNSTDSAPATVAWLRREVDLLNFEANSAAIQELHSKFPAKEETNLKRLIEVAMKGTRDELLNDVVQFQLRNRRVEAEALHEWLTASRERYQAWLKRL